MGDILKASGVLGIWPANAVGDDIEVYSNENRDKVTCKFYGLRQQLDMGEKTYWCQSDFIAPKGVAADYIAAFAELIHLKIRKELWGYAPDEALSLDDLLKVRYQGIRPAPGYPSQPDRREKTAMWELLDVDN